MALLDNPYRKCDLCEWRTLSGFCRLTACIRMNSLNETKSSTFIRDYMANPKLKEIESSTQEERKKKI